MEMRKLILTMLLAAVSNAALAEWTEVGTTDDDALTAYVDTGTIVKKGSKIRMWWMNDFENEQKSGDVSYTSSRNISEFECNKKQMRQIYSSLHSESLGEGDAVAIDYEPEFKWTLIEADSIGELLFNAACGE
jgi:hypothetical protein